MLERSASLAPKCVAHFSLRLWSGLLNFRGAATASLLTTILGGRSVEAITEPRKRRRITLSRRRVPPHKQRDGPSSKHSKSSSTSSSPHENHQPRIDLQETNGAQSPRKRDASSPILTKEERNANSARKLPAQWRGCYIISSANCVKNDYSPRSRGGGMSALLQRMGTLSTNMSVPRQTRLNKTR